MEVIKVVPRGYCKGVTRAISIAKESAKRYPNKNIYVLGMLVHNRYVMEALKLLNIHAVEDPSKTRMELLEQIPNDSVVIFTAHGIAPSVIAKAKERGLLCIDASCPDVVKTQEIVQEYLSLGFDILYIGKKGHPEAEAILSLNNRVHLITNKEEIHSYATLQQVFVTNQTTMSIFDIQDLFQEIKNVIPSAIISEEICNATRIRQEAVAMIAKEQVDVLYVVGDRHSNNSNRLAQIAKEHGIHNVYLIDDVYDINEKQLEHAKKVAVTSGASTPTYLTSTVIEYLQNYELGKEKPIIDIHKIL